MDEIHETAERIVRQDVLCCLSGLVHTLASGYGAIDGPRGSTGDVVSLCEKAFELSTPVDDWEEGVNDFLTYHGGTVEETADGIVYTSPDEDEEPETFDDWEELARHLRAEPYQHEVFEHWVVSGWLANKLEAAGEKIERDFDGLCVWARTTTGQGISMDGVIERIARDIVDHSDKLKAEAESA